MVLLKATIVKQRQIFTQTKPVIKAVAKLDAGASTTSFLNWHKTHDFVQRFIYSL
jgi:hypothetical protein